MIFIQIARRNSNPTKYTSLLIFFSRPRLSPQFSGSIRRMKVWVDHSATNGFEPRSPGLVTQHPNYYPKAPYETKVTLPKNVHHGLYLLVKLKTCKSQLMLNADYTIYIFQNILRNSQKNILSNLVGLREFGELFYIMYKLAIAWA